MLNSKTKKCKILHVTHEKNRNGNLLALVACGSCCNFFVWPKTRILNVQKRDCGCQTSNRRKHSMTRHGLHGTPTYKSWRCMKERCLVVTNKDYPRYGGMGITICPEWIDDFQAFFDHVGERPPGCTLDRINTLGSYEPGNVRWATPKQQARNRKNLVIVATPKGVMPLIDYSKTLGITSGAALMRLKRGKLDDCTQL